MRRRFKRMCFISSCAWMIVCLCLLAAIAVGYCVVQIGILQGLDRSPLPLWSSWTELFTFVLAVSGALVAWHQWRKSCEVTRSEHLREMLAAFKEKDISEAFYICINNASYGGMSADDPKFYVGGLRFDTVGSIDEGMVDNMLLRFSAICHDHNLGVISDDEFEFFSFQIWRALAHSQVKQYLLDMAEYCGKYKCGYMFRDLIEEGLSVDEKHYSRVCAFIDNKLSFEKVIKEILQWFSV